MEIKIVSEAGPFLRSILERGGSATLIVGSEWRTLWYDARFGCELRVSEAKQSVYGPPICGKLLRRVEVSDRSGQEGAIAQFLEGAPPDGSIMFGDRLP